MRLENVSDEYFDWLYNLVCEGRYHENLSYHKLLRKLFDTEFTYTIRKDRSRASDGVDLRWRFAEEYGIDDLPRYFIDPPCGILEMMIALALRCEETIMDDPQVGNRTGQWFWGMISNLGLGYMSDGRFDEKEADIILYRFLNRDFEPNGRGGLFTVRNCEYDLRRVEIWTIMLWYLDGIS